ncbi:MAG: carbon storage regulator, partial [Provencibacterium sp.]|nr:carbon storage regulator [Provencibacterium sp.]
MLVLGRNLGDAIVINDNIYITVFETNQSGNKFKIAIDAPKDVK